MCSLKKICETIEKVNYLQMFLRNCNKGKIGKFYECNVQKIKQGTKVPIAGPLNQCTLSTLVKRGILKKKLSHLSQDRCFNLLKFLFLIDVVLFVHVSDSLIKIVILSIRLGKVSSNRKQNLLSPTVTTSHNLIKSHQCEMLTIIQNRQARWLVYTYNFYVLT